MGASNDLTALLVIVWLFGLIFVLASLFRPVPPFRSRTQAFFLGLPGILIGPFVIAIALGWAPAPREGGATVIATAPDPQSASRPPEDAGPSPLATTDVVATTTTTTPAAPSATEIVGLTHINKALGKRVSYREPRTKVLVKQDVPEGAWTIKELSTKVICFADGNNAVFFTIGERFIAANGKARQFVRHKAGDGIVLANDKVAPVEELERGTHIKLVDAVIDAGLDRRRLLPDTDHPGLNSLIERRQTTDEDFILLLAAEVSQFRSIEEILDEAKTTAERAGIISYDRESTRSLLSTSRRDLHSMIDQRLSGFARCGIERIDEWADQFRLDRRISLDRSLVLLSLPADNWKEPPKQAYVSTLLEYFSKKISGTRRSLRTSGSSRVNKFSPAASRPRSRSQMANPKHLILSRLPSSTGISL